MKLLQNIFKLTAFILLALSFSNISISSEKNYYKDLVTDWSRIFPDNNRNAAGPKFFKYIIDKDITYNDIVEYNKVYCAVSGSLIALLIAALGIFIFRKPSKAELNKFEKEDQERFNWSKMGF